MYVLKYIKTTCSGKFIIEEFYFVLNLPFTNIFQVNSSIDIAYQQ